MRVVSNHPLKAILAKPEHSGRLLKWAIELSEFNIIYTPRTAIKAQALTDFLVNIPVIPATDTREEHQEQMWTLYVDGASGRKGIGIGVVLKSPS